MDICKSNIISKHSAFYIYILEMHLGKYYSGLSGAGDYEEGDAVVNRMKMELEHLHPDPEQESKEARLKVSPSAPYLHQEVINSCQAMSSSHVIFLVPLIHQWGLRREVSLFS